jgi:hypothetical protein
MKSAEERFAETRAHQEMNRSARLARLDKVINEAVEQGRNFIEIYSSEIGEFEINELRRLRFTVEKKWWKQYYTIIW